ESYETQVGEKGTMLSGGQRQRIAIARAVLKDPRILVLDDATSSVDSETELVIQQALWRLMRRRTSFVIAQRVSTARRADAIIVLDKGRLVDIGRHDDLLGRCGLYADIYYGQLLPESHVDAAVVADAEAENVGERD
ncbi:MAG: ATP-binding cassette domain-containing protein, partial [Anaerolineae bacterium]